MLGGEPQQVVFAFVTHQIFKTFLIGGVFTSKNDLTRAKLPKKPPEYLGDYGKEMWQYLIPYFNQNKSIIKADQFLIAQYCSAYDVFREAYRSVKKDGLQQKKFKTALNPLDGTIVARDFTGYAKNPSVQMMSDALNKINMIGKELGLSPKSRNELINLKTPEEDNNKHSTADQLREFFK